MRSLERRAAVHAALGDPARLAIVDELAVSDRSPSELRRALGIESNLLAHHLDVLQDVGVITRSKSTGDGRRRYIHLVPRSLTLPTPALRLPDCRALFVCTHNSARSVLAAAMWRTIAGTTADSAGTHPAKRVHPGTVSAARRAGLALDSSPPKSIAAVGALPSLVVTVCDRAHEELGAGNGWLHWSVPDPVADGSRSAFDRVVAELHERVARLCRSAGLVS